MLQQDQPFDVGILPRDFVGFLGQREARHAGEEALHAAMKPFGGFDHNAQTLRILTKLEERYAEFNGLNLTWETLEGAVKHNGPLLKDGRTLEDLPAAIVEYCQDHDLELEGHAGAEAHSRPRPRHRRQSP